MRHAQHPAVGRREGALVLILLAGVLCIGARLRFAQLEARGLLLYDEGVHLLVARFLSRWWTQILAHGWSAGQVFLQQPAQWGGFPSSYCKPGHDLLLTAAFLCGGPTSLTALRAMAVTGTLALGVVYWLGRRAFDAWVGLVAAALSAVSTSQLLYARSTLAEADASLWVMLAVGVLVDAAPFAGPAAAPPHLSRPSADSLRARTVLGLRPAELARRLRLRVGTHAAAHRAARNAAPSAPSFGRLLMSGACGGIAFLVNCSLPMILPCLWIVELLRARSAGVRGWPVARWAWLAVGWIAPILCWTALDGWLMRGVPFPNATYAAQFGTRLLKHGAQGIDLAGWYAYPYLLTVLDGGVVTLLCALGLLLVWWQRAWTGRAVASVGLVVIGCYSVYHTHHARYMAPVLPFLLLAAAWMLVHGARRAVHRLRVQRLQPFVLAGLVLALLWWRLPQAVAATRLATGYAQVAPVLAGLEDGRGRPFITTQHYILRFLTGARSMPPPPTEALLRAWVAHYGVRYFVVDYQLDFGGFGTGPRLLAQALVARLTPVAVIPNPAGASPQVACEHVTDVALTRRQLADAALRARHGVIAIYDLWQLPALRAAVHQQPSAAE